MGGRCVNSPVTAAAQCRRLCVCACQLQLPCRTRPHLILQQAKGDAQRGTQRRAQHQAAHGVHVGFHAAVHCSRGDAGQASASRGDLGRQPCTGGKARWLAAPATSQPRPLTGHAKQCARRHAAVRRVEEVSPPAVHAAEHLRRVGHTGVGHTGGGGGGGGVKAAV